MTRGIVFDYNGVLADDLLVHATGYATVLRRHGADVTPEDIMKMMATTAIAKIQKYLPRLSEQDAKRVLDEQRAYYRQMSATRDLLFPQTRTVIPTLAKTHRLGIITNSTHAAIDMVLPQELRACFDEIITYEQIALPKPHPSSILELLTRWKMPASECAYVGDAKNDMVFAKNAGVIAVGITTGECTADELREAGADRVVDSLSGLLDI